jgi:hypothetical protein
VVKDFQTDDVVLIVQPNLPRGQRLVLGRILKTFPSKDEHNKVAQVQIGDKSLMRPIHKLVPLNC